MDDNKLKIWDLRIKVCGVILTATSIYFGLNQVSRQQKEALEAEKQKNFWRSQDEIYTHICNDAGAIVANIDDPEKLDMARRTFLTHYYGETGLVEDPEVNKNMKEIQSQLIDFNPEYDNMVNNLKTAVFALTKSCQESSKAFKLGKRKK